MPAAIRWSLQRGMSHCLWNAHNEPMPERGSHEKFFQETTSTIMRVDAVTGQAEEVLCKENSGSTMFI